LGIESALQVIGHPRKGTQQLLAFGRDLLLCQAPLPLAKVRDGSPCCDMGEIFADSILTKDRF
jgi:hypothetical protein